MSLIKKIAIALLLAGMVMFYGCKNPCKGVITYISVDNRLLNYVFQPGTYWIYQDTVDAIIDSQYVYKYIHLVHDEYLNPDTIKGPNPYTCRDPLYTDVLQMQTMSFYNNIFADTLMIEAAGSSQNVTNESNMLSIFEHWNTSNTTGLPCFILDYSKIGLIYSWPTTLTDTSSLSYEGTLGNLITAAGTFSNVNIFRIKNADPTSTRFTYPTDLYFCSGYGIIRIVEHRTSGDVPWNLLRYKIVN